MGIANLVLQNVLSPAILFFALGAVAGFLKSDLEVPRSISRYLSLYLMMAIGLKGGVAISNTDHFDMQIILAILSGVLISFFLPFLAYFILRLTTKLDRATAAAAAAQYGSIGMVSFVAATTFLKSNNIGYAGYIVAILALMEAPAILSGLFIAYHNMPDKTRNNKKLAREILANGAILLLSGSFIIGWVAGQDGMDKISGFYEVPFQGLLCLFLLDMGLLVAKNLHHIAEFTWSIALFAIYMPIIGGIIGLAISYVLSLDLGTGTLFTILCASASYIAVPAAMRLALPEAKAAIYLPMSLAITFPFNIIVGIPLFFVLASKIL